MFPLREDMPTAPVHPYAQTKVAVEQMLAALCRSGSWPGGLPALFQSRRRTSQWPHR